MKLAEAVVHVIEKNNVQFKPLYDWNLPVKEKIEIIVKEIYGADGVYFGEK